ncbi:hypothetical protein [Xanthomonas axonopodis]
MSLKNTLNRLICVVIEEAERNPDFEAALTDALDSAPSRRKLTRAESSRQVDANEAKRGKNRRAPAVLDPVQLARDSESGLRSALEKLSLDQLRDIVAEYGMDHGRLVMKWNTPERVIERVVEMSVARANKGNAFRKSPDDPASLATDVDETPPLDDQVLSSPPKGS